MRLAAIAWVLAILPIGALIAVTADTWAGRAFGGATGLIALMPLGAIRAYLKAQRGGWYGLATSGVIVVGITVGLVARAPNGSAHAGRIQNHFQPASERHSRFALSNLLPEEDQLLAGFTLAPMVDPIMTTGQGARLRQLTRTLYRELEQDAGFREVGSAMGNTYTDILGHDSGSRHCYTYAPANLDRSKPTPVFVFFHGSGGNFKAYLWILSKVADHAGFILVAPSGGMGGWPEDKCADALSFALEAAATVGTVDRSQVHIAGLSNGGLAVSRLLKTRGSEFASATFISPVFDGAALRSAQGAEHYRGKPILVVSGALDDRVPLTYVSENAAMLASGGAKMSTEYIDSADHFLIFSHREQLTDRLIRWFAERQ